MAQRYNTITLPEETMRLILDNNHRDTEVVSNELYDSSRWSLHYNLIFSHEGKFYQTQYSRGATECQYERPFEYEGDVTCTEVEERVVPRIGWEPVVA